MKRKLTIATAAAALAIPAIALGQAAQSNHLGELIDVADSRVKFKERIAGDQRSVTSFTVRDFTVGCAGGTEGILKVAKLTGSIDVSDSGAFKVADDNGETVFKVKGQIKRSKSTGIFRYFGQIESEDGVVRACDSGKLAWVTRP